VTGCGNADIMIYLYNDHPMNTLFDQWSIVLPTLMII
jgi:hypothetical protein